MLGEFEFATKYHLFIAKFTHSPHLFTELHNVDNARRVYALVTSIINKSIWFSFCGESYSDRAKDKEFQVKYNRLLITGKGYDIYQYNE